MRGIKITKAHDEATANLRTAGTVVPSGRIEGMYAYMVQMMCQTCPTAGINSKSHKNNSSRLLKCVSNFWWFMRTGEYAITLKTGQDIYEETACHHNHSHDHSHDHSHASSSSGSSNDTTTQNNATADTGNTGNAGNVDAKAPPLVDILNRQNDNADIFEEKRDIDNYSNKKNKNNKNANQKYSMKELGNMNNSAMKRL